MFTHKLVVGQLRIGSAYALNFHALSRTEFLMRVQAPNAFEQPLSAQHLMNSGNTAGKPIRSVENGGVGVCEFCVKPQHFIGDFATLSRYAMTLLQQLHGSRGPYGPLAQQSANNPSHDDFPLNLEREWGEKIHQNIIVLAS